MIFHIWAKAYKLVTLEILIMVNVLTLTAVGYHDNPWSYKDNPLFPKKYSSFHLRKENFIYAFNSMIQGRGWNRRHDLWIENSKNIYKHFALLILNNAYIELILILYNYKISRKIRCFKPVSYTHLTLPTICSV